MCAPGATERVASVPPPLNARLGIRFIHRAITVFIGVMLLPAFCRPADPYLEQVDIFTSGTEGYHTFRIPAIVVTNEGTLLAFCEGHKLHMYDAGDLDIVLKRSFDGGKTWGPLQVVWSDGQNTCGGPTAVVDRDTGTIWLHSRWNHGADWQPELEEGIGNDTIRAFVLHSTDDGATWSAAEDITSSVKHPNWRFYAPGPGVGIQLERGPHKGRLVIPCCNSTFGEDAGHDGFRHIFDIHDPVQYGSYVTFSDDHGKTWQRSRDVVWPGKNECQVVELADGRLMLNMRNYNRKFLARAVAYSEDGGNTWSEEAEYDETLISPICQASYSRFTSEDLHDRNRVLFSNPADTKHRRNMTVRLSYDEGQTWAVSKVIDPEAAQYSCLTVMPDMSIGLIYEAEPYEHLRFARFNLEWLTDGADSVAIEE